MIMPEGNLFSVVFLKLNSSKHRMVTTLRPAAADGIGTVLYLFEIKAKGQATDMLTNHNTMFII